MTRPGHPTIFDTHSTSMGMRALPSSDKTLSVMAFFCSCAALVVSLVGWATFDLPITKYVRSVTVHLPWDQLAVPWMAFTSNFGDWVGQGWRLAFVSLLLLAVAWAFNRPMLKVAAIQSLIAHGIAAILANGLKHLIGRPRPKFTHSGDWQITMSFVSGLDSFPSGHSTASFAVATVLAKRFPIWGPLCISLAAFVALSRVLRGSHFPTDAVGGAIVGVLSGSIAAAPFREWRTSLQEGCRRAAIGVSVAFAVLWTLSHKMDDEFVGTLLMGLGAAAIMASVWIRWTGWKLGERSKGTWHLKTSLYLMGYGLAAMTTSLLVVSAVGFTCLACWFHANTKAPGSSEELLNLSIVKEGALFGGLALAVLILVTARGVLPF